MFCFPYLDFFLFFFVFLFSQWEEIVCQLCVCIACRPLAHTVNYACSEHKHSFYSKTVFYTHIDLNHPLLLSLNSITDEPDHATHTHTHTGLCSTPHTASQKANMWIRWPTNIKSKMLNKWGRLLTSSPNTANLPETKMGKKCLLLHGSVSVDF